MTRFAAQAARAIAHSSLRQVLLAVVAVILATVAALLVAADATNQTALKREIAVADTVTDRIIRTMQDQQDWAAIWDDAVRYSALRPSPEWLRENVGTVYWERFKTGYSFVLGADDTPITATIAGVNRGAGAYDLVATPLRDLVRDVRNQERARSPTDRSRMPLRAYGIVVLDEVPFAAVVSTIVPHTVRMEAPSPSALLVTLRELGPTTVRDMALADQLIDPRITLAPPTRSAQASVALAARDGAPAAWLVWTRDKPGDRILRFVGPTLTVTIAILVFFIWRALTRANQATAEIAASQARAQHAASHDPLTGLANRALMSERLNEALAGKRGAPTQTALLTVDLENFKEINDVYGHHAGDEVLKAVGARIDELARPCDTVARLGGDEFQMLLTQTESPAAVAAMARRVLKAIEAPVAVGSVQIELFGTLGIAFAEDGMTPSELARRATIALHRAKTESPGAWIKFDPEMDESTRQRRRLEAELKEAIESDAFSVHYQPQMSPDGQRLNGVEALLRWPHAQLGMVSPGVFIPIAEETGLIRALTLWTFRRACIDSRRWPGLSVAVNISPILFKAGDLPEVLWSIITETEADPRRIEIEITESVLLDDTRRVRIVLDRLRAFGFKIALDDFGTGYSSLSYLRGFKIDKIKIDQSFVRSLEEGADAAAIVQAVVSLGRALGLSVTAEGVETPEQHRFLRAAGCAQLQGFLFSRAVPADEITRNLESPAPFAARA